MSNKVPYGRLVHRKAWNLSKDYFQWKVPTLIFVTVFAFTWLAQGHTKAAEVIESAVIGAEAAVAVAVCAYLVNAIRATAHLYAEQEEKTAVYRQNIASLGSEVAELRSVLDRSKKNQALADALTLKHKEGVTDILNRPPLHDGDIQRWRDAADKWLNEVKTIMTAHHCTVQDMNHVETIGVFAILPALHPLPDARKDLSMFVERLNRVANISTKYAG